MHPIMYVPMAMYCQLGLLLAWIYVCICECLCLWVCVHVYV